MRGCAAGVNCQSVGSSGFLRHQDRKDKRPTGKVETVRESRQPTELRYTAQLSKATIDPGSAGPGSIAFLMIGVANNVIRDAGANFHNVV